MYNLRDYQEDLIEGIYNNFRSGIKKVIGWAQTGAGKTICFCSITRDSYNMGLPVVIVMRRRKLVDQTSRKLDEFKIPHGVYMANHRRKRPRELVQVCSIDTLSARDMYPHEDKKDKLIILDESHDVTPKGKKYRDLMNRYEGSHMVGFTATPFSDNSLFQSIVKPIEAHELRDRGYLVPERTWVPNVIDTRDVKITKGDFNERELFEVSSKKEIIGDFVRDWKNYAQNRPTILFAVNIEHSKMIKEAFISAGIRAEHIDGKTGNRKREQIYRSLSSGHLKVLTNVDVASTGLDIPEVSAIQICRPTQSIIWHLQAIGRGLRTCYGKENCIIIDNAGNTLRHGSVYKVREAEINAPKKKKKKDDDGVDISIKRCKNCLVVYEAYLDKCPMCGHQNPKQERKINQKDGELVEYEMSEEEKKALIKSSFVSDYHKLTAVSNRTDKIRHKRKWVWHKLQEKYGLTVCKEYGKLVNMEF